MLLMQRNDAVQYSSCIAVSQIKKVSRLSCAEGGHLQVVEREGGCLASVGFFRNI
jgi:hypothetical protein